MPKESMDDERYSKDGRLYDTTTILVTKETRNCINRIKNELASISNEKITHNDVINYLINVHRDRKNKKKIQI